MGKGRTFAPTPSQSTGNWFCQPDSETVKPETIKQEMATTTRSMLYTGSRVEESGPVPPQLFTAKMEGPISCRHGFSAHDNRHAFQASISLTKFFAGVHQFRKKEEEKKREGVVY